MNPTVYRILKLLAERNGKAIFSLEKECCSCCLAHGGTASVVMHTASCIVTLAQKELAAVQTEDTTESKLLAYEMLCDWLTTNQFVPENESPVKVAETGAALFTRAVLLREMIGATNALEALKFELLNENAH